MVVTLKIREHMGGNYQDGEYAQPVSVFMVTWSLDSPTMESKLAIREHKKMPIDKFTYQNDHNALVLLRIDNLTINYM